MDFDNDVTMRQEATRRDGVLAVVDQFELLKALGSGGFGTVYLARDTTSDIEVALKVVGKDRKTAFCSFGWDEGAKSKGSEGLERELRDNFKLIHGLTHPNIAVSYPLHLVVNVSKAKDGVSIANGDILSVMAYAPGVTLDKWRMMFEGGRVPERLAADIVAQIASALDYAHSSGVIHRDVKPSNIMVDTRKGCKPVVRLLDFGLASAVEGGQGVCGTPQYMSPEQWGGDRQDERTDQYSLAVLACELLTGHVPLENVFSCDDREVMRIAVINRELEFPRGLSPSQRKVIAKAMAKSPTARFATCGAFAEALRPRSRRLVWFACALLLVSTGAVWCLLQNVRPATAIVPLADQVTPVVVSAPGPITPALTEPQPEAKAELEKVVEPEPDPEPVQKVSPPPAVKQDTPKPASPPKPTLDAKVQARLRQANQGFVDLKLQYRDPEGYEDIERLRQRITAALKSCAYEEVGQLEGEYSKLIATKRKMLSQRVEAFLREAKKSQGGLDWNGLAKSCDQVIAIEPGNREAIELKKKMDKSALLRTAKELADKKSWRDCLNTVNVVLEIDPDNRQAQRLQARAENGLSTQDSPEVATPQNTLRGAQDANGIEMLNQRKADDDWRHQRSEFFK